MPIVDDEKPWTLLLTRPPTLPYDFRQASVLSGPQFPHVYNEKVAL